MSGERTNEGLQDIVTDNIQSEIGWQSKAEAAQAHDALDELTRRANEATVLRRALEMACTEKYYPCARMGWTRSILEHRVCLLGCDIAECWTFGDGEIEGTGNQPSAQQCAVDGFVVEARKELGL